MLRFGLLLCLAATAATGCGKKGPPLAPIRNVPERVGRLHVRQVGERILLGFSRPGARTDGTALSPDARVELLMSLRDPAPRRPREIEADAALWWVLPASEWKLYAQGNRLEVPLTLTRIAGDLEIPGGAASLRGRRLSFVAQVVEGKRDRSDPSDIETFVVCDPPAPPGRVAARIAEDGLALTWSPGTPAPAAPGPAGGAASPRFNIYRKAIGDAAAPEDLVHTGGSADRSWLDGSAAIGRPYRYEIRVAGAGAGCESAGAPALDLTRVDLFPPAPPQGLAAVAERGAIRLFWRSSREIDLRGYRVYRADGPEAAFRLITAGEDLTTTSYTDEDVTAGVVYSYAVTARDGGTPPNESLFSEQAIETMKEIGKDATP